MTGQTTDGWRRREFLASSGLVGAAGLLGVTRAAAEPPPETTRIRLVQTTSMCQAPQYVAEELLRAEGFTQVLYLKKDSPEAIAGAVASGEADINMHFSGPLIIRLDRGEPVTILAGVHPGWTFPADESIERLRQGTVDAFMGFPPRPQELRLRKIGHVLVNSNVDRPWSQYFCCMVAAHRDFGTRSPPSGRCGPS
jgi:NitT/TauT family transport system substrate-binding protein